MASHDLVVVGAGIVGLAHALAAARRGLRVAVLEREARAAGASVRNFGFVTITGQADGDTRRRALRSRAVWEEAAGPAGIEIVQRGAVVVARRPEALALLEEFAALPMGAECALWGAAEARKRIPGLAEGTLGALSSPHELRVEARTALPRLAAWLEHSHGVRFHWGVEAIAIEGARVIHREGAFDAGAVVIAPGNATAVFAPEAARKARVRICTLQMMRLAAPGKSRLPAVVMTDLSLIRYGGFASLPGAQRLRERLAGECAPQLENGVHLIVAQGADGSLVVGDSHHYGATAEPFASAAVDELILNEMRSLFTYVPPPVLERWVGHYPVAEVEPVLRVDLAARARLVTVTSGTGMSTAFAIGEETVAELFP